MLDKEQKFGLVPSQKVAAEFKRALGIRDNNKLCSAHLHLHSDVGVLISQYMT